MNVFKSYPIFCLILIGLSLSVSGCGLVKAPFRVAGALTNAGYQGGKKVATKTSDALERRKERKEKEKAAAGKKPASAGQAPASGPSESLDQLANPPAEGPIIPLPDTTPLPPPN